MKKIFLTSALAMSMLSPAMADVDIVAGANTADCDSDVLKTTTGPANLEANWNPNTISLNWYAGSDSDTPLTVQTGAQTCTYDGNITLPTTNPTKPGYTFDHWIVREILFNLSTLNASTGGSVHGFSRLNGTAGSNEAKYGLTPGSGEWAAEFSYGTIKGTAYCSAKGGNNHSNQWGGNSADWTASESELTSASGEAKSCWCKPTGFDAEKDGSYVGVASPSWVFYRDYGSASDCADDCARGCAISVRYGSDFRAAIYGVTQ